MKILLSVLGRKGGEGELAKIITDENKVNYPKQLEVLMKEEEPLLCFKEDEQNWILLSNERILIKQSEQEAVIPYSELIEVNLALEEEFADNVMDMRDFTRLVHKDRNGSKSIIKLEKGEPYQGVYQVLHFLAQKNKF